MHDKRSILIFSEMQQTTFNVSPKMSVLYLKFFHELVTQRQKQQIARWDTNNTFFHSLFFQIHVQSSAKLWSICLYTQMLLEHQDDNVLSKKEKNDNWFNQVMSCYLATVGTYMRLRVLAILGEGLPMQKLKLFADTLFFSNCWLRLSAVYMQSFLNDQFPLPLLELLWHSYKLKATKLIILITWQNLYRK